MQRPGSCVDWLFGVRVVVFAPVEVDSSFLPVWTQVGYTNDMLPQCGRLPVLQEPLVARSGTGGGDGDVCSAEYICHLRNFSGDVVIVILYNAEGINPQVRQPKLSGDRHCVLQ